MHSPARRRGPPLVLGLLALAGAAAAAVVATHRGAGPAGARVTVTQQGTTVVHTVTAQQPASTPAAPATSAGSGQALALEGYGRIKAGDYAGAIPLLEQAAQQLRGSGSLDEAYNDYNLAYALVKTSGCSDRVLQLLDRSEALQGHRTEIDRLRASCR